MSGGAHDWHENLPGYNPEQIWVAGCEECEHRSQLPIATQLDWLDDVRFARACARAWAWETGDRAFDRASLSPAEMNLLRTLYALLRRVPAVWRVPAGVHGAVS